jgi:hypothetical protein
LLFVRFDLIERKAFELFEVFRQRCERRSQRRFGLIFGGGGTGARAVKPAG